MIDSLLCAPRTRRPIGALATTAALAWLSCGTAVAQNATRQTQADDYTVYELLAPASHRFRIVYDVSATTAGARVFLNPIRPGSEASDERVIDLTTGTTLPFAIVRGPEARILGVPSAADDAAYIKVSLAAPVPPDGEQRIRIDKTYRDPESYRVEPDGSLLFRRSLGIRRNRVVLPPGYELTACTMPVQISRDDDERIAVSFVNVQPGPVPLEIRARPHTATIGRPATRPRTGNASSPAVSSSRPGSPASTTAGAGAAPPASAVTSSLLESSSAAAVAERAGQDREIVYFLQAPESHAFSLYHDYTESRAGVDRYVNVVRGGSRVSDPSARMLDTGENLKVETLRGNELSRAGIDIGGPVHADSEAVVVRFPAVPSGQSRRLRITETYTDPARYGLVGDTLVWRRSFGRPHNVVVLPEGWMVTAGSMPAAVSIDDEGRVRLTFVNPRPDDLDVLIRARRRAPPSSPD